MANGNGNRTLEALNILADTPLGKLLMSLLVWIMGTAFAAGYLRSELTALKEQINKVEAKVDSLSRTQAFSATP